MISRVNNETQKLQYIDLSIEGNWDTRTLQRNIVSRYVGRILVPESNSTLQAQNIIQDPYTVFYPKTSIFLPVNIGFTFQKKGN
jgi:predicted nuclease of restriction endonuclease-like (RecB) superfamily